VILEGKWPFCVFELPSRGLRSKYVDHFRLIGKRIVDFLLVLIELFSLGVMAEELQAIICSISAISLQRWPVDPKFQVEGVTLSNHSFSQKTMLNVYLCEYWQQLSCMVLYGAVVVLYNWSYDIADQSFTW